MKQIHNEKYYLATATSCCETQWERNASPAPPSLCFSRVPAVEPWTAIEQSPAAEQRTAVERSRNTGHEHYDRFRIINANARLYDPVIGRFFSPNPFVQAPDFTQNYNSLSLF